MTRIAYTSLLAATLVALASPRLAAQADPPIDTTRWVFIASAMAGSESTYVDTTTVQRTGGIFTVWVQYRYLRAQRTSGVARYTKIVERDAFDCAQGQFQAQEVVYYDGSRVAQTLSRADLKGSSNLMPPGSTIEGVSRFACSLRRHAPP